MIFHIEDFFDVHINLNNADQFSRSNLATLLASFDEAKNCQLRVSKAKTLGLYEFVEKPNKEDYLFWFPVWCAGNDYHGRVASEDVQYVDSLFKEVQDAIRFGITGLVGDP